MLCHPAIFLWVVLSCISSFLTILIIEHGLSFCLLVNVARFGCTNHVTVLVEEHWAALKSLLMNEK